MPLTHLALEFDAQGPAYNCLTACAASTQAIGEATEILRRGDADVMITGGAHTMIHPLGVRGFNRLSALSNRDDDPQGASRPFSVDRDGFVMGEGAAMSMNLALEDAGLGLDDIDYISAHGTGTKENDSIETRAVKLVFGEQAKRIPFSSVKSMFGHLIQAAGAVELMTCIKAIETGWVPPTINLRHPDPECDLDYVPNSARDMRERGGVDVCLSNSFGFGGQNNTIIVKRFSL